MGRWGSKSVFFFFSFFSLPKKGFMNQASKVSGSIFASTCCICRHGSQGPPCPEAPVGGVATRNLGQARRKTPDDGIRRTGACSAGRFVGSYCLEWNLDFCSFRVPATGRPKLRATVGRYAQCLQRNSCTAIAIVHSKIPMCRIFSTVLVNIMAFSLCSWHLVAVSMDQRFATGWTFGQVVPAIQGLFTLFFWFTRRISSGPRQMFFCHAMLQFLFHQISSSAGYCCTRGGAQSLPWCNPKGWGKMIERCLIDDFGVFRVSEGWFSHLFFLQLSIFFDRFLFFFSR